MRIFERLVCKQELSPVLKDKIGPDQFAYKNGCSTSMALIKCQHHWLDWLDKDADFVRVLSFDFSKAFDSVSHRVLCDKLKSYDINPYIINSRRSIYQYSDMVPRLSGQISIFGGVFFV